MEKRFITLTLVCATCLTLFSSCFKDEASNAECDIEKAYLHVDNPTDLFYNPSDTLLEVMSTESTITFNVRKNADISALAPRFILTPGAVISPANGSVHDFTQGAVTYTVTSEDGSYHRSYDVKAVHIVKTKNDTTYFDFDHYQIDPDYKKFYEWQRVLEDGSLSPDWATGNPGFRITAGNTPPEEYPSAPLKEGNDSSAVQLTTRYTGTLGKMFRKPIAAGNLFLGKFNVSIALSDALKATRFGVPFDAEPVKLIGYYKYTPGDTVRNEYYNVVEGRADSAAVYAVLYHNVDEAGNSVVLDGHNVKTSPQIVAIADMGFVPPVSQWTPFEIAFQYTGSINQEILENRGYSLTIVFSSSKDGDIFLGATGSTLCIKKVRIISTVEY